jgi:L-lysine 2,3-aminomutase (EC 5.4.3.2)
VPVNNQAVLLKDVNDDKETMLELMRKLLSIKVKPQYLFHCDPITGTIHFRTSIEKGLEIMDYIRGRLSGFGIPTYAIDLPGGKGKVPLVPSYFKKLENGLYEFVAFDKTKVIIEE